MAKPRNISLDDLPPEYQKQAIEQMKTPPKKKNKYRNTPCYLCPECSGIFKIEEFKSWGMHSEYLINTTYYCPAWHNSALTKAKFTPADRFDSILEATAYVRLCKRYSKIRVKRQCSFPLINGDRIRPDFVILGGKAKQLVDDEGNVSEDNPMWGLFRVIDTKGYMTKAWKLKADMFFQEYGIRIKIIRK